MGRSEKGGAGVNMLGNEKIAALQALFFVEIRGSPRPPPPPPPWIATVYVLHTARISNVESVMCGDKENEYE